jgi:hypothetical protein
MDGCILHSAVEAPSSRVVVVASSEVASILVNPRAEIPSLHVA